MTSPEIAKLRRKIIDGLATSGGFAEGLLGEKRATELLTAYTVRVLVEHDRVLAANQQAESVGTPEEPVVEERLARDPVSR